MKLLDQGLNPHHVSDPNHSSDNSRSLTTRPPGNPKPHVCFFLFFLSFSFFLSSFLYFFLPSFLSFTFLGLHLQHMGVPRLGVELDLQLPAYITATAIATQDLSCICYLQHSSWQHGILNQLSEARNQTRVLTDTSQVCYY